MIDNVIERTNAALESLGVPYAADAFYCEAAENLPDLYLVYSWVSSVPVQWADDAVFERLETVQVRVYSRVGMEDLPDIDAAMRAQGFRVSRAEGMPIDQLTGHYGQARNYIIS